MTDRFKATISELVSDVPAERSVLAAVLLDERILGWIDLDDEHFFDPRHRKIWTAFRALESAGKPIDTITVESVLHEQGVLAAIGGLAYLGELASQACTPDNAEHYAQILRDRYTERRVLEAASRFEQRLRAGVTGIGLLDESMSAIAAIERPKRNEIVFLEDLAEREAAAVFDVRARRRRGEQVEDGGFPLPTPELQRITGGAALHTPIVVAGRPAVGKSSFCLAWALHLAETLAWPGDVYSWEDRGPIWGQRTLAREAKVDSMRIRGRDPNDIEAIEIGRAAERISKRPRLIRFEAAHGWGVRELRRSLLASKQLRKIRWAVLDYMQLIPGDRGIRRNEQIDQILCDCAAIAGELEITLIIGSQLNREAEEAERPELRHLRDSGAIEQHCKFAAFLREDRQHKDRLEVHLLKHTVGAAQGTIVPVTFRRDLTIIQDLAVTYAEPAWPEYAR